MRLWKKRSPDEGAVVAIICPECRREYDVTLFQLGRTIHCTCGRRVGLEHRLSIPETGERPRFIADAMLGRLARWLRTLGYDTAYEDGISDESLVRRSLTEGRHILTRDRRLFDEWTVSGTVLDREKPLDQLREVVRRFHLPRPRRLFRRCRECNAELQPVPAAAVEDRLPERVAQRATRTGEALARCPECDRVYWEGSHTRRMRAVVDGIFED